MTTKPQGDPGSERIQLVFKRIVTFGSLGTVLIALAGLLGCIPKMRVLGSIRPDYIPMAPSTAICFLILSAVLFFHSRNHGKWTDRMSMLALLVTGFALLNVLGNFLGLDLSLENRLFPPPTILGTIPVGRMSPATGSVFIISGLGIFLLLLKPRKSKHQFFGDFASSLGVLTVLAGTTVLLAYLYGTPLMYGGYTIPMAATTAIAFLLLGIALISARGPAGFPTRKVFGDSTSARLSRVFLPLVIGALILQSVLSRFLSVFFEVNDVLLLAVMAIAVAMLTAFVVAHVAHEIGGAIDEANRNLQRVDAALRHERDLAQGYLDTVETIIVALNKEGQIITINRKGCQIFASKESELIGQSWFSVCLPQSEDTRSMYSAFLKIIAGEVTPLEYSESLIVTRNGELRQIVWHNALLRDEQGEIIGVLSAGNDITERKQTEDALSASEEQHRNVLQTAMDGFWMLDMQGQLLEVNETYCRMSGYNMEELLGMHISDLEARETADQTADHRHKIMAEGEERFESRHRRKDGSVFDVEISVQHQAANGGRFVVFLRDITDRKQEEKEKAKLEAQLQQSQKMESVGRLAGGVAHDFNNMLGVILGHVDLAFEHGVPTKELFADLEEIHKAATRSAELTRQLLAFARKQTIEPKVLNLNQAITGMIKMLERLLGENIRLDWRPDAECWLIKIDPSQLDQILINLCVNARDAIKNVGIITIEAGNIVIDKNYCATHADAMSGDYVRLAVSDNGCGMDKETLARIFEPFFTTKEMGKGTGLGLAMVYGVVKQNSGFINVYSEPGQGTNFSIYLPRQMGEVNNAEKQEHIKITEAQLLRGQETILLVEDEPAILKMTTTILRNQGYTVLAASSTDEGICLAKEHTGQIDLLLTDVILPKINGRDFARQLQSVYPRIKLLFMSGYTANVIVHHGVLDRGVNFIQKPFSIKDLASKVRLALDSDTGKTP